MHELYIKHDIVIDGRPVAYRILLPRYIEMIDEALAALEDYGEVRLIVERGRLRFLVTQKSYDLLKFRDGEVVHAVDP
jgi:hypothetical protein